MFRCNRHASRSIAAISIVFALVGASAAPAKAQTVEQAGASVFMTCEQNPTVPGAYNHCALTLKRTTLERQGVVVGRPGFLRPIDLTQFVAGDSAMQYARLYERQTSWATRIAVAGLVLAASPFVASRLPCHTSQCTSRQHPGPFNVGTIVGVSLIGIAIPLKVHGRRQGYKAVSFYNASLGR